MELHINSTAQLTHIDGVAVRVFIHRIAVDNVQDQSQFDIELQECLQPGRAIDLRHVL